jgi:15-cis-phytoene synthase
LGRSYFPAINPEKFGGNEKYSIEQDINKDFTAALEGIRKLPKGARLGVYLAYAYYRSLFNKIKSTAPQKVMNERIRIPNNKKFVLLIHSYIRHSFNSL